MKTNRFSRRMLGAATSTLALLAMTLGTAAAQIPSTTAFFFSSHPMISGTVVSVNDHQMVVDTDQGDQVTLEVDSRTMAPRDVAPGMVMRAEFRALEDCRLYAERIMPIRHGMSTDRMQAYANTRQGGTEMAASAPTYRGVREVGSVSHMEASDAMRRDRPMADFYPGRSMTATHSTQEFQDSNRPLLSGTVISVNDHRMLVETDQGQKVALTMDSNTMLPREVRPGSIVRAQFTPFTDGRYYAQRISRIGHRVLDREQAYAHTRDSEFANASTPPDCEPVSPASTTTSYVAPPAQPVAPAPVYAQRIPDAPVAEAPAPAEAEEALPQTASNQPLILLFGLGALGLAGLVAVARALRIA